MLFGACPRLPRVPHVTSFFAQSFTHLWRLFRSVASPYILLCVFLCQNLIPQIAPVFSSLSNKYTDVSGGAWSPVARRWRGLTGSRIWHVATGCKRSGSVAI